MITLSPPIFPRQIILGPLEKAMAIQYPYDRITSWEGSVSVKSGKSSKGIKRLSSDRDFILKHQRGTRNTSSVFFNGINEKKERTHKEIYNLLQKEFPDEEADMGIDMMTQIVSAPSSESSGINDYYLDFVKYGNWYHIVLGLGFICASNPYYLSKNELKQYGLWDRRWEKRLRGIEASQRPYTLTGNQREFLYGKMTKKYPITNVNDLIKFHQELLKHKSIIKDIAVPRNEQIMGGTQPLPVSTYNLLIRNRIIAMGWDSRVQTKKN